MATQSNVCQCSVCGGSECHCGCQMPATPSAATCQCVEVCNCGEACTCNNCQHVDARVSETR